MPLCALIDPPLVVAMCFQFCMDLAFHTRGGTNRPESLVSATADGEWFGVFSGFLLVVVVVRVGIAVFVMWNIALHVYRAIAPTTSHEVFPRCCLKRLLPSSVDGVVVVVVMSTVEGACAIGLKRGWSRPIIEALRRQPTGSMGTVRNGGDDGAIVLVLARTKWVASCRPLALRHTPPASLKLPPDGCTPTLVQLSNAAALSLLDQ